MTLFHLVLDGEPILNSFSPVEIVEEIMKHCKEVGQRPVDVYTTEVK